MSKHEFKGTRGEWRVRGREVGVKDRSDTQSHGMLNIICTVDQFDFAEHWQANAQAISAVPDLIQALNDCVALFVNGDLMAEDCGPEYRAACAALAKATGERTGGGEDE